MTSKNIEKILHLAEQARKRKHSAAKPVCDAVEQSTGDTRKRKREEQSSGDTPEAKPVCDAVEQSTGDTRKRKREEQSAGDASEAKPSATSALLGGSIDERSDGAAGRADLCWIHVQSELLSISSYAEDILTETNDEMCSNQIRTLASRILDTSNTLADDIENILEYFFI